MSRQSVVPSSDDGIEFALRLGTALQRYGAPAHRLEAAMREVVETLGIEGEFFSTPTVIFVSLGAGAARTTQLLPVGSSDVDLTKMTLLAEVGNAVIERRMNPSDGLREMDRILAAPPPYGALVTLLSFGVTSAAVSALFGAGIRELL